MVGFSARIKNACEYRNAAMIPGMINNSDHKNVKIETSRINIREGIKLLKPANNVSRPYGLSLDIDR